jgi:hypothetical protein
VVFKHLWENLIKEILMSPLVFGNIDKSFTPYFKLSFNFTMAWYLLSACWYVQNVSPFPNTFAIVSSLICVFWMQLTRTDAVFSRIALVSRFCAEIQLPVKIQEKSLKIIFLQKTHEARIRDGEGVRGAVTHRWRSPALAAPPLCEEAPGTLSVSPLAYIYPLTT